MKCFRELKINIDMEIPGWVNLLNCCWIHGQARNNLVNWNILVARGKINKSDFRSSGEWNDNSLNRENEVVGEQCKCCVARQSGWVLHPKWRTPKLLDRLNWESKNENNGRKMSWGTFFISQHFKGRGACWSSRMGSRMSDNWVNYSHRSTQTKQWVG